MSFKVIRQTVPLYGNHMAISGLCLIGRNTVHYSAACTDEDTYLHVFWLTTTLPVTMTRAGAVALPSGLLARHL